MEYSSQYEDADYKFMLYRFRLERKDWIDKNVATLSHLIPNQHKECFTAKACVKAKGIFRLIIFKGCHPSSEQIEV